ncbi:hypothetical protein [Pararhizobium sp.]|uniref:hypothetical protein n=1 Tax=Pararhizobium sp. TaxID=1977563 RepID=UPI002D80B555|nr:hypothetical protein [Pararhizobium sp.]
MKEQQLRLLARLKLAESSVEDEMVVLMTLPPERRDIAFSRMEVIARYLDESGQSTKDAEEAAAALGTGLRNFYRFVARVQKFGPAKGLAPGYRNVQRAATARDGLPSEVEMPLRKLLKRSPEARPAEVYAFIEQLCREKEISIPSEPTVRRRLAALRQSPLVQRALAKMVLGSDIVVDQCAITLPISGHRPGQISYATVTLVVDRQTKLVLGAGIAESDGIAMGLSSAIFNVEKRLPTFAQHELQLAQSIDDLRWTVPPDLEYAEDAIFQSEQAAGLKITVKGRGVRRHGAELRRLLGNQLGGFEFRNLTTASAEPVSDDKRAAIAPWELLQHAVDGHNQKILARFATLTSQSLVAERSEQLTNLRRQLDSIFTPVFDAVDDTFEIDPSEYWSPSRTFPRRD